jgi:hypothetical protein
VDKLVFDRVVVTGAQTGDQRGRARELSAEDFLELAVHDRVRLILERRLKFYRDGEPVDQTVALKSLRR